MLEILKILVARNAENISVSQIWKKCFPLWKYFQLILKIKCILPLPSVESLELFLVCP